MNSEFFQYNLVSLIIQSVEYLRNNCINKTKKMQVFRIYFLIIFNFENDKIPWYWNTKRILNEYNPDVDEKEEN